LCIWSRIPRHGSQRRARGCPHRLQELSLGGFGVDAGQPIVYISTDAGQSLTAVLERSTYVPALDKAAYNGGGDFLGSARKGLFGFIMWSDKAVQQGLNSRQIDENVVFNLAATRPDLLTGVDPATGNPAPYGSVGVDINGAVIGFIDKAPTANLADPVPNSQFPPRYPELGTACPKGPAVASYEEEPAPA